MAKIICPNCGKKSENPYNCDHCGSMLVQFAAKGIGANELHEIFRGKGKNEGKEPFCFTDDYIFPALKAELTACYNYAKDYPPKQPKCALSMSKSVYSSQVDAIQLSNAYFYIGCVFYQNEMHQLLNVIVFNDGRIDSFSKPSSEVKYLLDNLFHHEVDGRKITYFCDCGEDIDGATRLMSYLIQQRVHIAETAPLIFKTSIDGQFKKLSSEKCPVCGKDSHGDFSCEHCGSMLLQFERRGINYDTSILKTIEPLGNLYRCIKDGMARCTSGNDVAIKIADRVIENLSGRDDMQENLLDAMARISIEIKKDEEDQRQTNIYVAIKRKNVDDVDNETIENAKVNFDKPLREFARRFKLANMFYTEFVQLSPKEFGFKFSTCCGQDVLMAAKFATGILKAYDDLNVLDTLTDIHFVVQGGESIKPTENEPESKNEQATESRSSSVADSNKTVNSTHTTQHEVNTIVKKVITCPNCGASTTNVENCEHCGSFLVRFVDKGIDLSKTSYINDSATFPRLATELKRNLKLQEEHTDNYVTTDLWYQNEAGYSEGVCINDNGSERGLCVVLGFQTYTNANDDWQKQYNRHVKRQLETFKKLDCFTLVTSRIFNDVDKSGHERYCREYTIDFGNDAEGAARLTSEILQKVYKWTLDTDFDMFTEVGDDIYTARYSWEKAHGFKVNENTKQGGQPNTAQITKNSSAKDNNETESKGKKSSILEIIGIIVFVLYWILKCSH